MKTPNVMTWKQRLAVALCAAAIAVCAAAEDVDRVLLPIAPGRLSGAFGSEWVTDLTISNLSSSPVRVSRLPLCTICEPLPLPGEATVVVPTLFPSEQVKGQLAFVEKGRLADVVFTLRSRDTSRQFETWGTSVPVVRPDQLFGRTFGLVDVPMEPQFRATLRIYDVNAATAPRVRVRVYAVDPLGTASAADPLIADFEPSFAMPLPGQIDAFPASAEIPLWLDQELLKHSRIRIELEPLDVAQEYWAFVSVTHNTTQHVTIITP